MHSFALSLSQIVGASGYTFPPGGCHRLAASGILVVLQRRFEPGGQTQQRSASGQSVYVSAGQQKWGWDREAVPPICKSATLLGTRQPQVEVVGWWWW